MEGTEIPPTRDDVLIAMAITVAFVASWVTTLGWAVLPGPSVGVGPAGDHHAAGTLAGQAPGKASALDALAALLPDEAERKSSMGPPGTVDIPSWSSRRRTGEGWCPVPADGTIIDGELNSDERDDHR